VEIKHTAVFVGANRHHHEPAIRLTIDFGRADGERLWRELPAFMERLGSWGEDDRWLQGRRSPGMAMACLARELLTRSGTRAAFSDCRRVPREDNDVWVLYGYDGEEVGVAAGDLAFDILDFLTFGEKSRRSWKELCADYDDFLHLAERRALGPSTRSLIKAAEDRGIPWFRLNTQSLIQLGHGRFAKRIEATTTSNTSMIGTEIAKDKSLAYQILSDLGLPVPKQRVVYSLRRALEAAERIGYPVVVKPLDGNHGRGVTVNILNEAQLEAGYDAAKEHGDAIIVEQMVRGFDHRLLVINGKLEAAARRMPGHVTGDGRSTVKQLVDLVNRDPRRGIGHEKELTQIQLDAQALSCLEEHGMSVDSVPAEGDLVLLRRTANLSTGGTAIDVTDVIHPDNREMAERAIKAVGLDIGGVDFLSEDITVSYKENGAGICEVNAGPGFRMHVAPSEG